MGGRRSASARTSLACRRAQSSMEYLLVTTFAFVILLAIVVVAYSESANFSRAVSSAQVQKVGNTIIDSANSVYYAGYPTKKTITLFFPEHIKNVTVTGQNIIFFMQGEQGDYEYALYASTNMTGVIHPFKGLHTVSMTALGSVVNITDR